MQFLTDIWLYFLADSQNRTCSWVVDANGAGRVVKNNTPTPLPQHPKGWQDIEPKMGTNSKYFFMQRTFSAQLMFVNDGANILRWYAYNGKGIDEDLYLIIMKWNREGDDGGKYILEYNGRIDFSKMSDDPYRGVTVSTLEGGILQYLNANDSVTYNIPCDHRVPNIESLIYDGINLSALLKYNFVRSIYNPAYTVVGMTLNNTTGDFVGIVTGQPSQTEIPGNTGTTFNKQQLINNLKTNASGQYFLYFTQDTTNLNLSGTIVVQPANMDNSGNIIPADKIKASIDLFLVVLGKTDNIIYHENIGFNQTGNNPTRQFDINLTNMNYSQGDKLYFIFSYNWPFGDTSFNNHLSIVESSILTSTLKTKQLPSTAFFLRPLALFNALMQKMSNGKYSVASKFFTDNDKLVVTCGDAIRNINIAAAGIDGYNIKTSWQEAYTAFNAIYCLGFSIRDNVLWIEPRKDLFNESAQTFDLGEVSDFTLEPATDMICNSVKVGYKDENYQGLTQNAGKLAFNASQEWTLPIATVKKAYEIISPYIGDCYLQEFIRASLSSIGAEYNDADNKTMLVLISDEQEELTTPINTFIDIDVNLAPTTPTIVQPNTNETVTGNKPTVTGYGSPNTNVGIIVDGIQEGFTITNADGFYAYNIQNALSSYAEDGNGNVIVTGQHTIAAAFAPPSGILTGQEDATQITIVVDTTFSTSLSITNISNGSFMYDNLPLLKGVAQAGTAVSIYTGAVGAPLVLRGTATADGSCRWTFQMPSAISDGAQVIQAQTATETVPVNVTIVSRNDLKQPLITVPTEGFIFYIEKPTFKGVAVPNTTVLLYIDFAEDNSNPPQPMPFAQTTADQFGNWTITPAQWLVLPTTGTVYQGFTGGNFIISTTPLIDTVNIGVMGYKLFREQYKSITGVNNPTDDSYLLSDAELSAKGEDRIGAIFNFKNMSPKQMLLAHGSMLAPMMQQTGGSIINTTASKNKTMRIAYPDGRTFIEAADIRLSELGAPLCLYWYAKFTTRVPYTFSQIMKRLSPGYVSLQVKGYPIKCLTLGDMSAKPATDETQNWKLLLAPSNALSIFMQISNSFLFIQNFDNSMLSITNLNPLQHLKFETPANPQHHYIDINDAPFAERLKNYLHHGHYFQPWQKNDAPIQLQYITANVGLLKVIVYGYDERTDTVFAVKTVDAEVVNSVFVQQPYKLQQIEIPVADLDEGIYGCVLYGNDTPLAQTEWINVQDDFPDTLLFNYKNSFNRLNGIFDNWNPSIRVESMLMREKPDSDFTDYEDENKDEELLHAVPSGTQELIIGYGTPVPDWLAKKMNEILLLNSVTIDGIAYTRDSGSKFEEIDISGSAQVYYKTTVRKSTNNSALVISDAADASGTTVAATLDGEAFGQAGNVINIEITKQ